ncbi:putative Nudix hydrolase NudL [bacterium HR24]|jgi:8-oxo-dGTP pyrophosphatase MutT (NUDIX family)|nr:putative Nudix hydrolase NudL [bacterium HR24]
MAMESTGVSGDALLHKARAALAAYSPLTIREPGTVPAAVLVPLYLKDGEVHVLFTERTHHVEHHKGQISFPGGARDPEDPDLMTTALRESYEEAGIRPEDVEVIGRLDDIITITNFLVTPYVGVLRCDSGYQFCAHPHEVASLLEVPLPHLLDWRNMELELRQWRGTPVLVPAFRWNGYRIWGATARILKQFLDLLQS